MLSSAINTFFYIVFLTISILINFSCDSPRRVDVREEISIDNMMLSVGPSESYQHLGPLRLSEYGFFKLPLKSLDPVQGVLPYDLNSPLFTDYASKQRFIYVPKGSKISYESKEMLQYPVGTVLIKNFYYAAEQLVNGQRIILETWLLINKSYGWIALPYVWNVDQTEAFLEITGGSVPVTLTGNGASFEYIVPTMIECKSCHETNGILSPIGPSARQLNKPYHYEDGKYNQLQKIIEIDWLIESPENKEWPRMARWEDEKEDLSARARAYLDINCGHCHRPEGPAKNSGLDLSLYSENAFTMGINKAPVAAGKGSGNLNYDIVPGKPGNSIIIYRMKSNDPGIMMPELGRSLAHIEGIELLSNWIKKL